MTISLVMIARNAEQTLPRALASVIDRPGGPIAAEAVIVLGGRSTDRTREVAEQFFKERGFDGRVYDLPDSVATDSEGRLLDFAGARNFAHAQAKHAWHLWIDSDDAVPSEEAMRAAASPANDHGEAIGLQEFVARLPATVNSIWLPYHYLIEPTTKQVLMCETRERIIRWTDGFRWQGLDAPTDAGARKTIHEHVVPVTPNVWMPAILTTMWIEHHPDVPFDEKIARNVAILKDLEPHAEKFWRVAYYVGDAYFTARQYEKALEMMAVSVRAAKYPHERYASYHQMARMCLHVGRFDEAEKHALYGYSLDDTRIECHADLVLAALAQRDMKKSEAWYARYMPVAAKKPHSLWAAEVLLLPHLGMADMLLTVGKAEAAIEAANAALAFEPRHEDAKRIRAQAEVLLAREKITASLRDAVNLAAQAGDVALADTIADALPAAFADTRELRSTYASIRAAIPDVDGLVRINEADRPAWAPQGVPAYRPARGGERATAPLDGLSLLVPEGSPVALLDTWPFLRDPRRLAAALPNRRVFLNAPQLAANAYRADTPETLVARLRRDVGRVEWADRVRTSNTAMLNAWVDVGRPWPNAGARIRVFAPSYAELWGPTSPDTTGMGGCEEQIVIMARWLGRMGHDVEVLGGQSHYSVDRGVAWRSASDFDHREPCDILIAHRSAWVAHRPDLAARTLWVWLNDQPESLQVGQFLPNDKRRVDAYITLCETMQRGFKDRFGIESTIASYLLPACDREPLNGTLPEGPTVAHISAPYRGLPILLDAWPKIRETVPDAELLCCYGWQTMNRMALDWPSLLELRAQIERTFAALEPHGAAWIGRLPQAKVRDVLRASAVWAYPCTYPEMLSLSALRAMANGAYPVYFPTAALAEVVQYGTRVEGDPNAAKTHAAFAQALQGALELRCGQTRADREASRAVAMRWHDRSVEQWKGLLRSVAAWVEEAP